MPRTPAKTATTPTKKQVHDTIATRRENGQFVHILPQDGKHRPRVASGAQAALRNDDQVRYSAVLYAYGTEDEFRRYMEQHNFDKTTMDFVLSNLVTADHFDNDESVRIGGNVSTSGNTVKIAQGPKTRVNTLFAAKPRTRRAPGDVTQPTQDYMGAVQSLVAAIPTNSQAAGSSGTTQSRGTHRVYDLMEHISSAADSGMAINISRMEVSDKSGKLVFTRTKPTNVSTRALSLMTLENGAVISTAGKEDNLNAYRIYYAVKNNLDPLHLNKTQTAAADREYRDAVAEFNAEKERAKAARASSKTPPKKAAAGKKGKKTTTSPKTRSTETTPKVKRNLLKSKTSKK